MKNEAASKLISSNILSRIKETTNITAGHFDHENTQTCLAGILGILTNYSNRCIKTGDTNKNTLQTASYIGQLCCYITALVSDDYSDYEKTLCMPELESIDACKSLDDACPSDEVLLGFLTHGLYVLNLYDSLTGQWVTREYAALLQDIAWHLIHIDQVMSSEEKDYYIWVRMLILSAEKDAAVHASAALNIPATQIQSLPLNHKETEWTRVSIDTPRSTPIGFREKEYQEILSKVNNLIGLDAIKKEVIELGNLMQVMKIRADKGLPKLNHSMHMVFYGNPGTGKTSIARLIGEACKSLGVLSSGHLIETDRSGLVGGYLGQTAIKTIKVLESARGGILFIDEAYSLCQDSGFDDVYGKEAIDTIVKFMEDNRDDIVIIAAGYTAKMQKFINSNPGLRSRFNKYFNFPDYSSKELLEIFCLFASQSQYTISEAARMSLLNLFEILVRAKKEGFGNGRLARNIFEQSVAIQSSRIISMSHYSIDDLMLIQSEDIELISLKTDI